LPEAVKETAADRQVERQGAIQLKFVDSLTSAFRHLAREDERIAGADSMESSWSDWISYPQNPVATGEE
jgi:3-mercaptopyruvate sulfurtransferase SseA